MLGKINSMAVFVSMSATLIGVSSFAAIPKGDVRDSAGAGARQLAAAVVATDQATGQSCIVDTDIYPVHALRMRGASASPMATSTSEAVARSGGRLPVCSAEVNTWASESSKVAYVDGGPQVAMAPILEQVMLLAVPHLIAIGAGYYLTCSTTDVATTLAGEMVRSNDGNPKATTGRAPLAAARLASWFGGVVGFTVCVPVTAVNWTLSWILVK